MSEMTSISCRKGRVPTASMMISILRTVEEAADMKALEYHESRIRERRTLHKPTDANGEVLEDDIGDSTFRYVGPTKRRVVVHRADEKPKPRPHRFRI